MQHFRQWEVYFANLNPTKWKEQQGIRPVVIISGNSFNSNKQLVMVCPITSKIKNFYWDIILTPSKENGLTDPSEILIFHMRTISTERCIKKIWTISFEEIQSIRNGIQDLLEY